MTMLMMYLDETSVALATDSIIAGRTTEVPKLHKFQPDKIMFGVGFGDTSSFVWLNNCPCPKHHPYPEHWRDCSSAQNLNDLERIIKDDLRNGNFPPESHLELWLAGVNDRGILEAFVLNGKRQRVKELILGEVHFNGTVTKRVHTQSELKQRFHSLKKDLDDKHVEFSGAKALEIVGGEVIDLCKESGNPYIGGRLQYHVISVSRTAAPCS
jgi:hypothetical protein